MPETEHHEIRVTVDGGEFYTFARAMKRNYQRHVVGEVVLSVRNDKLIIETARSGCVLSCNSSRSVTARLKLGNFTSLVNLATDAKASGPLEIVFRPTLGEIGLPHIGTKAKFEPTTES